MAAPVSNSSQTTDSTTATPASALAAGGDKSGSVDALRCLSPQNMASQKEIWKLEQYVVGALVRVDPDPPVDNSVIDGQNNALFHLVRDDHRDVFSFSTSPELYGGVDVSFASTTHDATGEDAVAVYVVIDRRTMKVVYHDYIFFPLEIPYVPGFLAFREIAPLEILVQQQIQNQPEMTPQAIFVDGNGILHPRNAGIACFLGTRTDIPTIGIGKSLLYGCGWTRESVDEILDQFVKNVHATIGQRENRELALQLSRTRGLIMKKRPANSGYSSNNDDPDMPSANDDGDTEMTLTPAADSNSHHTQNFDRQQALVDLAPFCNGLAIPLTADGPDSQSKPKALDVDHSSDSRFSVLGCALVGHGGQIAATTSSKPQGGSCQPIFVSVGHKISLQEAVRLSASLSVARIPEPVRKADLFGRELLRQREAAVLAAATATAAEGVPVVTSTAPSNVSPS